MTALFIRQTTDSTRGRLLASFPGTPDDLRALVNDIGASLGPLDTVLVGVERHHPTRLAELRATLQDILEGVRRYRAARAQLPAPYDPEDPRRPNDDGENQRAWFLFTQGDELVSDLECVLEHLKRFADLGVEEIIVTGYP